ASRAAAFMERRTPPATRWPRARSVRASCSRPFTTPSASSTRKITTSAPARCRSSTRASSPSRKSWRNAPRRSHTMATPTPDKLKLARDLSFGKHIFLSVARHPETGLLYLGSSEFKVLELDPTAAKPEPKELYSHESYVTGLALIGKTLVSGSYD